MEENGKKWEMKRGKMRNKMGKVDDKMGRAQKKGKYKHWTSCNGEISQIKGDPIK